MARPGLDSHRKFRRLVRLLGCPRPHARGYLELLWDHAYEEGSAFLGDADDVEDIADWPGEPGELASALAAAGGSSHAGFLEPGPHEGTLRIHHLFRSAPAYVRKRRLRAIERETGRAYKVLGEMLRNGELDLDHPKISGCWVFPCEEPNGAVSPQTAPFGSVSENGTGPKRRRNKPNGAETGQTAPFSPKRRRSAHLPAQPSPAQPSEEEAAARARGVEADVGSAAGGSFAAADGAHGEVNAPEHFRNAIGGAMRDVLGRNPKGGDWKLLGHWHRKGIPAERAVFVIEWLGARRVVTGEPVNSLRYFAPALAPGAYPQPPDDDDSDGVWADLVLDSLPNQHLEVDVHGRAQALLKRRPTDAVAWGVREGCGELQRRSERGRQ